ncbi:zinc dependent phospholipase C family protein [Desulfosporosinus sp. FKA]|uniref:zinc dependent phospholipase C family protein n=1 Tax=Desulfosporosinus sp. FKA TaxID=1969834 RepID=UPI000B49FE1D|nr:zinc dependent phospholipase C family protein [Desulfosporosinus sp. FKA]
MRILSEQTLNIVTKALLVPVGPLQMFLDAPLKTHGHCLHEAYHILEQDGKNDVLDYFRPYDDMIIKGLFWADKRWKNICHYFSDPQKQGGLHWPGADAECQYYFNKAITMSGQNVPKGMFYLGAALHLVQDMCVPHHALGVIFDGHQEFERWTSNNLDKFTFKQSGIYKAFTHPSQWIRHNVELSAPYYPLVSAAKGIKEKNYFIAAEKLLAITVYTTAGFLDFSKNILSSGNAE